MPLENSYCFIHTEDLVYSNIKFMFFPLITLIPLDCNLNLVFLYDSFSFSPSPAPLTFIGSSCHKWRHARKGNNPRPCLCSSTSHHNSPSLDAVLLLPEMQEPCKSSLWHARHQRTHGIHFPGSQCTWCSPNNLWGIRERRWVSQGDVLFPSSTCLL